MSKRCETFVLKSNDKDVTFKVYEPGVAEYKEASKARNEAFIESLQNKAPLRSQINTLLRGRGQWDDERESQYNTYTKAVLDKERLLKVGGIKLSQARQVALEMKEIRGKLRNLLSDRSILDNMTAEGQADNAHFNALVTLCLVYNDEKGEEKRYFNNLDDYLVKGSTDVASKAANVLATMIYTVGDNAEKSLPENQFLTKYKFADEKLRLINKDGHLIDEEGRLIDENSRFVDKDGNFVDKFGQPINEAGDYLVDAQPFLDDDGNPIIEVVEDTKATIE